jgi:hypothetical protein
VSESPPAVVFILPWLWIAAGFLVSIIYRRRAGKPIRFFTVPNALFLERFVSGRCEDSLWRQLGGARKVLVVAVADSRLIVRPVTPFNLMFLPEIYGLEHDVPLRKVVRVRQNDGRFARRVLVTIRTDDGGLTTMSLDLSDPYRFMSLLREGGVDVL